MSIYELLSTTAALNRISEAENGKPAVSDDEWAESMALIENLAQFDPSIKI